MVKRNNSFANFYSTFGKVILTKSWQTENQQRKQRHELHTAKKIPIVDVQVIIHGLITFLKNGQFLASLSLFSSFQLYNGLINHQKPTTNQQNLQRRQQQWQQQSQHQHQQQQRRQLDDDNHNGMTNSDRFMIAAQNHLSCKSYQTQQSHFSWF